MDSVYKRPDGGKTTVVEVLQCLLYINFMLYAGKGTQLKIRKFVINIGRVLSAK